MAANAYYRKPTDKDIAYIAERLRQGDADELRAARGDDLDFHHVLQQSVQMSDMCWCAVDDITGTPVCVFGVFKPSLLADEGVVWLLGTEDVQKYGKALMRMGRFFVEVMQHTAPQLFNYVDARNKVSIRWLKRLGFTLHPVAPYGVKGLPFHRFTLGVRNEDRGE